MNATSDKLPLSRGQRALRILGAVLLTLCALMVILGTTILAEQLRGFRFMFYWLWCLLLACGAIFIALWDMVLIRRASRRTRRELFQQSFMRLDPRDRPSSR